MTLSKIKVDLVAVPFSGHLYPLLEIALPLLQDNRYEVRVFTGVNKVALAEKLGFTVIPLFPDDPDKMERIANTENQVNAYGMYQQLKQNLTLIPEVIDFLKEAFQAHQTDVVVADFVAVPAGIVCNQLGIPWITTIPTPFAIESQQTTPSYLGGWYPPKSTLGKIRDWFGRKMVRSFKRSVVWLLRKQLRPYDFHLYRQKEETIYSPYAILGLGMKELEFRDDFPAQFQWAGPCCSSLETTDISLDKKAYVLVTNGTHLLWGKETLTNVVCQLAQKYSQFHFLISYGDDQQEEIQRLRENVSAYSYLPYEQVLPQVQYVIHHGGAGILYNCIKYQRPALILPHDYDQFDYAVRAELAGVAEVANSQNFQEIEAKFQHLVTREWSALAKLSQQWSTYQPSQCLIKEIQRLKEGEDK